MINKFSKRMVLALLTSSATFSSFSNELSLNAGDSKVINLGEKYISSVFISDPRVADYKLIDNKTIIIYAKNSGNSTITVFDNNKKIIINDNIIVSHDDNNHIRDSLLSNKISNKVANINHNNKLMLLNRDTDTAYKTLLSAFKYLYPKDQIHVVRKNKAIIIEGSVYTKDEYDSLNKQIADTKKSINPSIIILSKVKLKFKKAVNVKLTFAEVDQSARQQLGINWSDGNLASILNYGIHGSTLHNMIDAMQSNSLLHILATPNLTVALGKKASFLAGGEYPVITPTLNGSNTSTVNYKEYGVKLNIEALRFDGSNVELKINPEFSYINDAMNVTQNGWNIPALTVRKVDTTLSVKDGQTFAIGGLLKQKDVENLSKLPFAGDIPILGALFSSSNNKHDKSELVIIAEVDFVGDIDKVDVKIPSIRKTTNLSNITNKEYIINNSKVSPYDF